jgi:hypothetical protein
MALILNAASADRQAAAEAGNPPAPDDAVDDHAPS